MVRAYIRVRDTILQPYSRFDRYAVFQHG
jgi:hypothetical protein